MIVRTGNDNNSIDSANSKEDKKKSKKVKYKKL